MVIMFDVTQYNVKPAGKVQNINVNTKSTDHVNLYSVTSYGIKGGNGTMNPIVGYSVKKNASTTTIETAQMK